MSESGVWFIGDAKVRTTLLANFPLKSGKKVQGRLIVCSKLPLKTHWQTIMLGFFPLPPHNFLAFVWKKMFTILKLLSPPHKITICNGRLAYLLSAIDR